MAVLLSSCVALVVDASFRVVPIMLVILATFTLLRLRDANLKHRAWVGVLVGMLSLPVLLLVLPRYSASVQFIPNLGEVVTDNSASTADKSGLIARRDDSTGLEVPTTITELPGESTTPLTNNTTIHQSDSQVDQSAFVPMIEVPSAYTKSSVRFLARVFAAIWLLGCSCFLIRTATGLFVAARLVKDATRVNCDLPVQSAKRLLSSGTSRRVNVFCHPEILVPVTIGWLRPVVLLPLEWRDWTVQKLESVLIHELTHVARQDFLITLLAEFNRCVYWFHPGAWWLKRTLSDLAEEACDDAAIVQTGNPPAYAGYLLEVAAALNTGKGSRLRLGLSMARSSGVEARIRTILDSNRPLAQRLSNRAIATMLLIGIPLIAGVAMIQPAASAANGVAVVSEAADEPTARTLRPNDPVREAEGDEGEQEPAPGSIRFGGQIMEHVETLPGMLLNGPPRFITTATVRLCKVTPRSPGFNDIEVIALLKVDQRGTFSGSMSAELAKLTTVKTGLDPRMGLIASAPGFASQYRASRRENWDHQMNFALQPGYTIKGQLNDAKGQAIAGAKIIVREHGQCDSTALDNWLSSASTTPPTKDDLKRILNTRNSDVASWFPNPTYDEAHALLSPKVDNEGRFEIPGVGIDDIVTLEVEGKGLAKTTLYILGRECQTVYGQDPIRHSMSVVYHGREFSHTMQPSVPVFGVLRDADSKEPIANQLIASRRVYGTMNPRIGYISSITDAQGRYRIEGLPIVPTGTYKYDGNSLSIRPTGLPYLENDENFIPSDGEDLKPIEFNIELRKAVIAKGRVTDIVTGKPVHALLWYQPFQTNPHAAEYFEYGIGVKQILGNDSRYETNEDGYFEIPVIRGRGVIAAKCPGGNYSKAFGLQSIEEFQAETPFNPFNVTPGALLPSQFHSVKAIDVPEEGHEFAVDLQLDPGKSVVVKFVDEHGKPVSGAQVANLDGRNTMEPISGDQAVVAGLQAGVARFLVIYHEQRKLMKIERVVLPDDEREITITVLPPTVVSGRLVDSDGVPIVDLEPEIRYYPEPLIAGNVPADSRTDANGDFEVQIPVGQTYSILGNNNGKYFGIAKDLKIEKSQHIDLGDLVVEGKEDWAPAKPKRDPVISD